MNKVGITATLVAVSVFFIFTANDSPRGVDEPEPGWVLTGILGAVGSILIAVRAWRSGAYTAGQVLIVRNVLRTYRVPAVAITGFDTSPAPFLAFHRTVVRRHEGRPISITALGPPRYRPDHPYIKAAVDELEAWRRHNSL